MTSSRGVARGRGGFQHIKAVAFSAQVIDDELGGQRRALPRGEADAFDTAARISFALWDTLPDDELLKAVAPYAGEKGNLRFPLDQPIPYDLIGRIVRLRARQNLEKASGKNKKK